MIGIPLARAASGRRIGADPIRVLVAAASGVILLATFLPWGRHLGHPTNGWEHAARAIALGDAVGSDRLRYLALAWYGIPLLAAAVWILLGTYPTAARALRSLAVGSFVLTAASLVAHTSSGRPVAAFGPVVVFVASVALAALAGRMNRSNR